MGDFLSGSLGVKSQYNPSAIQAGNPYNYDTLTGALADKSKIFNNQQDLVETLKGQIAGKGPNPAETEFKQNVAQNIANTQGVIASNRGLNPALAARMGANAIAAANADAAGKAAILRQNQEIQATNELGGMLGQEQQGNLGEQGLYVQGQGNAMAANLATAQGNQKAAQGIVGGIFGGAGAALGMDEGGEVPPGVVAMPPLEITGAPFVPKAQPIDFTHPNAQPTNDRQPESKLAALLKRPNFGPQDPILQGMTTFGAGLGDALRSSPPNATVNEQPIPSGETSNVPGMAISEARGGRIPMNFKPGGKVPGRAQAKGDMKKNDTVPAMLSPGEVVIPRSVTTLPEKQADQKGAQFLAAVLAKKKRRVA